MTTANNSDRLFTAKGLYIFAEQNSLEEIDVSDHGEVFFFLEEDGSMVRVLNRNGVVVWVMGYQMHRAVYITQPQYAFLLN